MIKNFKKNLADYWPFYLIIFSGLIFSINYKERLDLPIWDEASYSRGTFIKAHGWAPLYQVIYSVLNTLTAERVESFFINFYLQTFILLPILTMLVLKKLGKSNYTVFSAGFLILTAPWNFLVTPRVQFFNFIVLLCALLFRLSAKPQGFWSRYGMYYIILSTSLFVRQDNVILLGISLVFDTASITIQNREKLKIFALVPVLVALTLVSTYFLLGETMPGHPRRTINAYVDHHHMNNKNRPRFKEFAELSKVEWHTQVLKNAESIGEIISLDKTDFLEQISLKLKALPAILKKRVFSNNLSIPYLYNSWFSLVWLNILIYIILMLHPNASLLSKSHREDMSIFIVGVFCKSMATCLLLSPWIQYFFDSLVCILFLIAVLPVKNFFYSFGTQKILVSLLFISLLGYNYGNSSAEVVRERPNNNLAFYKLLKSLVSKGCIRTAVAGLGTAEWLTGITKLSVGGLCKDDLQKCLSNKKVDTIIYDVDFQNKINSHWANKEFVTLFQTPELYGFQKTAAIDSNFGGDLVVYTRLGKLECMK